MDELRDARVDFLDAYLRLEAALATTLTTIMIPTYSVRRTLMVEEVLRRRAAGSLVADLRRIIKATMKGAEFENIRRPLLQVLKDAQLVVERRNDLSHSGWPSTTEDGRLSIESPSMTAFPRTFTADEFCELTTIASRVVGELRTEVSKKVGGHIDRLDLIVGMAREAGIEPPNTNGR